MNEIELMRLYDQMKETEGATLDFEVTRDAATRAQQPGTTFSADALNNLIEGVRVWVWTRCGRSLTEDSEGNLPTHERIRVSVNVEVDGVTEPGIPLVLEIVDGEVRMRAAEDFPRPRGAEPSE